MARLKAERLIEAMRLGTALVAGELAEPLLKGGVLGGEPLECVVVMLALGVAELAEQLADAGALGADLCVGGLERLLSVQRPLLPGRLGLGVAVSLVVSLVRRAGERTR